jgi:hypothetical protein
MRLLFAYPHAVAAHPYLALRYLAFDREVTNLTYEIENVGDLVDFVSETFDWKRATVSEHVLEIQNDEVLRQQLRQRLRSRTDRNPEPRYGRRIGWYAIVRGLRPRLIVETGVHDGLGSAVLLRALERNADDGAVGQLLGFDIDSRSGWLVDDGGQSRRFELVVGDTRETLGPRLSEDRVDVFIHDSAHDYDHERFELELALEHAGERFALLSDNAHASNALADLCHVHGLRYAFFKEQPLRHFYAGAGIGVGIQAER